MRMNPIARLNAFWAPQQAPPPPLDIPLPENQTTDEEVDPSNSDEPQEAPFEPQIMNLEALRLALPPLSFNVSTLF